MNGDGEMVRLGGADYRRTRATKMTINQILNILWLAFGGLWMGVGWYIVGLIMVLSIIGIPWAKACFVIGTFTFWPFGRKIVSREDVTGRGDIGTGPLGTVGNVAWLIFGGIWLAIGHLLTAIACFVSIIGIPFGIQHLKLAEITLFPIGKTIVDKT